jgi:hypothetical protein
MHVHRLLASTCATLAAIAAVNCTSSETSVTAPSTQKCQVTASGSPSTFPAGGGSGTVAVSAARDCAWSLSVDAGWVTISGDRSGQGDASVSFSVAANPQPASRGATVSIAEQRVQLSQAAAPCQYSLSRTSDSIGASGGSLSVGVATLTGCSWSASSLTSWIGVASGQSGNASGAVELSVGANAGAARVGQVNIAGQTYTVNQDAAAGTSPPPPPTPTPSPSPSPSPPPPPPPGGETKTFSGTVMNVSGKCPDLTFSVGPNAIATDKQTKFKDISCGDVAKGGRSVTGSGTTDSSGVIHADIVQKWGGDDH